MVTLRAPRPPGGSQILGIGVYRPARVVSNAEIAPRINSSDAWIRQRSGIVTRRFAGASETVISMAVEASLKALAQAGVDPRQVGLVLLASMSFLEQSPAGAPRIAHLLGTEGAAAADVGAACAGFTYALTVADSVVRAGSTRYAVVVGAEKMSDIVDPTDRGTAFIFGDGAGAAVIGPADRPGIGPVVWGTAGDLHRLIAHDHSWLDLRDRSVPYPMLRMTGPEVFRWATTLVPTIAQRALEAAGIGPADLSAFILHQANVRIIDAAAKALRLPEHIAIARDIATSGNTSAASIPLAVDDLLASGALTSGGHALLVGFGAGLTYAAQVVTLP
jgi:3-oxoacyl-[acyl-carrier-protein] synthase-3